MVDIQIFDPPMCCPTGICGPSVDPALVRFAADVAWLEKCGVAVQRFNLSQQPQAFLGNDEVKAALAEHGTAALPVVLVNGRIASRGVYPSRDVLARLGGVSDAMATETP